MRPRGGAAGQLAALILPALLVSGACNGYLDFGAGGGLGGGAGGPACSGDGDCPAVAPRCDLAGTRTCVVCTGDAQCATAGALRCDPLIHRCVACVLGADCALGQACVSGRCTTTCTQGSSIQCGDDSSCRGGVCSTCADDNTDICASRPATPFCLTDWGICVACRSDLDCGGAQPRCDPVTRSCVQCASSADCAAPAPYCDLRSGACTSG